MRFFRQTLLSVCLVLPYFAFSQPVANDDNATTPEDTPVSVNIVANDTDPEFAVNPETVDLDISTPAIDNTFTTPEGDFSVDAFGIVTFTPVLNYFGFASLSYTVQNTDLSPQTSNTALITIEVTSVNDLPTITSIVDQTIDEDTQTGLLILTIGDVETSPADLIISASSDNISLVPVSNIVLGGSGESRTVQVTPLPDQSGAVIITLTVSDGTDTEQTSFTVTVNEVNDPPNITGISDQIINENGQTGLLAFTVNDVETPPASLTVTGSSDNITLVPNSNVDLVANGANWTVQVTPELNQTGSAIITLTVSDGDATAQTTFEVTVNVVNTPPTITSITDQTIDEDTQTDALAFTVGDAETQAADLMVTASSDNLALVRVSNIVLGGSGASRTVQVTPLPDQSGTVVIILTVSDGTDTEQTSFTVTVDEVNDLPAITGIADQIINENGQTGLLAFTVNDVETPPASLTVTGSSDNTALVPDANIDLVANGANWTVQVTPELNQTGSAIITLTVSDGDGTAQTTFTVTVNAVANTLPTITSIPNQTINEDTQTGALAFTVGDAETAAADLVVSATSDNASLIPNANILLAGAGANRTATITPLANQNGEANITLVVSDGTETAEITFLVTVNPINDVPTITSIPNQIIDEDTQTSALPFMVNDVETPPGSLIVTGASGNAALVPNENITIVGRGANRTVTITPLADQSGVTTITLSVSDGVNSSETSFDVTVIEINDPPTISSIADPTIDQNTETGRLDFTIGDKETLPALLTLTRTSSNTSLVQNSNIVLGGAGSMRNVNVIPTINQNGMTTITLTVSDGEATAQTAFLVTVTAVDAPPTITSIANQVINEDTQTGALPFSVSDPDLDPVVVSASSNNAALIPNGNISLVDLGSGNWTIQASPLANQSGVATITVTVSDGVDDVDETFTVTVNPVNDLPLITAIAGQVILEDGATGAIAFTISDIETPAANLILTGSSTNTTLVPVSNIVFGGSGSNRTVTVTPAPNQFGSTTITVTVTDEASGTANSVFLLTVTAVNDAPTITAIADQEIDEDQVGGTGLLPFTIGDEETLPSDLTLTRTSSNLTLVPVANIVFGGGGANRTVRVTPAANRFGTATITVGVSDGSLTTTTQFVVTVNAVNDAPTITSIADQVIDENTSTGPLAFTIGDVETPAASLTVTRTSSNTTLVPLANVVLGGAGSNRNVNITPAPNQGGVTIITITVSDGTATAQTSFEVTVNAVDDPPTISPIANQVINEDTPTGALAFTIGDPETAAGSLILTASSSNTTLVPVGNIVFGGSGSARTVTVTPAEDQSGSTTITINVSDGVNVTPETFQVTVNPVNDAPTITPIANQTINEDTSTGALVFTIGDVETPPASLVVTATSSNITLVPNANITLGGTGAARTISILPAANQFGTTTITINVSDGDIVTPTNFVLTVTSVNDAPTITAIADQEIEEDTSTGALAFTIGDVETPVGSLTVTRSSSNTTLVPIGNVVLGGSGASRTVTITPAANQVGVTTITLTVDDGTTTTETEFLVTVTPVNDPPTISSITNRTINEDGQTGTINFTISDPESASSTLTVVGTSDNTALVPNGSIILAGTGGTRSVNIIPVANGFGVVNITLTVSDGELTAQTSFQVTVNPVNDAPVIVSQVPIAIDEVQSVVLSLAQLTVIDPDNVYPDDFSLFVLGGANYSVVGSTITPVPDFSGMLSVPVFVNDGTVNSAIFNVQILVSSVNDVPVITGQQPLVVNEDESITIVLANLVVNDPDNVYPDDFTLTVLPGANYTFSGNTVTPALNYNGILTVVVRVNDGQSNSAPFNLQITVTPVNDPPVITGQAPLSTNEDTPITLVIGNFTVVDPEPTTYTLSVSQVAGPNYTVSGNTITPVQDYFGTLTVPVTVSDGFLNSVPFNATITVLPVNDPPVITGQIPLSIVEDTPYIIKLTDLTVTDVDNPGYPAGFTLNIQPGANYTFSGTTVTPTLDFVGTLSVSVRVNDGTSNSAPFLLQIEVTGQNDAPVITGQNAVTLNEDQSRTIVLADLVVTDPDNVYPDDFSLTVLAGTNYTFTGNNITPSANYFGTLTVNVRVNDGALNSNVFGLQVTVLPVNDPPTFNAIADITLLEDAAQQTVTITGISPGPLETQQVLLTAISNNTALIPNPVFTPAYNGTAPTATFAFQPVANMFGTATITVTAVDTDFAEFTRTFTITVTSVNDAPTLAAISVSPIIEDAPLQIITLTGISPGGGPSEASQVLSFILSTNKPEMFEIFEVVYTNPQGTASLRIKPAPNANGSAQITVRLQDDGPGTPPPNVNFVTRVFTLVITPVNDLPVFVSVPMDLTESNVPYEYAIEVIDVDIEPITLVVTEKPGWLTYTPGANGFGVLAGVPLVSGEFEITIQASDPTGELVIQSFTLTVNSRPVLAPITIELNEDNVHTFTDKQFEAGFNDPDGNNLQELEITELPSNGILRLNNNAVAAGDKIQGSSLGSLTYTPAQDYNGRDTLRWNAADGFLLYSLDDTYALLNIAPVNDPPVITAMESELSDTLKYEFGSEIPVQLTALFDATDVDGDNITSAEVGFKRIDNSPYLPGIDVLLFTNTPKITGSFDPAAGVLTLIGVATPAEYVEAIRSIRYNHVDAIDLVLNTRSVYITLSDGQSVSLQRSRTITLIYTFSDLNIPSAFTPNGDNTNEKWIISSANGTEQYGNAEIKIFNKRGLLLYETKGFEVPWDGIYNGDVLPSDTYFYTIDLNYNKVRYKGTVTILR